VASARTFEAFSFGLLSQSYLGPSLPSCFLISGLSYKSNGGEVDWIARDLLKVSTSDALKFLNDEYLEIQGRFPAEWELMANAHALDESCRPVVEEMIRKGGAKAIAARRCRPRAAICR
jgi:hypothetical protein